jgi:hypothetical protein
LFGLFVDRLDQRGDLLFFFELRVAADQQRNVILQQRTDNRMVRGRLHEPTNEHTAAAMPRSLIFSRYVTKFVMR